MSITYSHALQLISEIRAALLESVLEQVAEIKPRQYVLTFKKNNQVCSLLLCFQDPFLRFHLIPAQVLPHSNHPFAKKLMEMTRGKRVIGCSLLNEDRILSLKLESNQQTIELIAEFFPRRPNCYLVDEKYKVLASLNRVEPQVYALPPKPEGCPLIDNLTACNSRSIAQHYAALEVEAAFQQKQRFVLTTVQKHVKRAQKRLNEQQNILEKCQNWLQVQHEAVLLQSNLYRIKKGCHEVVIEDWEQEGKKNVILLDPLLDPHEQIKKIFLRAKKLRLGIEHAERQILFARKELERWNHRLAELTKIQSAVELEKFCQTYALISEKSKHLQETKIKEAPKPYYSYISESGDEIWVGKNAKANDQLTFRHAKGSDWWLHANDCPGSHVVLRAVKNKEPDKLSLADAAELALRFSKFKDEKEGDVTLTQVKFLKRMKSTPGQVMLSKHKVLHVRLDNTRWLRLKQKNTDVS